jgi:hypothetical protein
MTHDELLVAVKDNPTTLAVVELHKPEFHKAYATELDWYECSHCNDGCWGCEEWSNCGDDCGCKCHNIPKKYPCPTIQAIEKELG